MEFYVLDAKLNPIKIIQDYISIIWEERFREPGVLEIVMFSTPETKDLFRAGTYIGNDLTPRIMVIEEVEDSTSSEGERKLTLNGVGLERVLGHRVAKKDFLMLDQEEMWTFKNTNPAAIMRSIFNKICRDGHLQERDKIPYLTTWSGGNKPYTSSDNPEPLILDTLELPVASVQETFQTITDEYPEIGYRLYRNPQEGEKLYFDVYTGNDRTMIQSTNDPVVFSLPWGSLESSSDFFSIKEYYNIAYVFSKYGTTTVNSTVWTGFNRRIMPVLVTDQYSDNLRGTPLTRYLAQKGREALAEQKRIALFDGEVPKNISFEYFKDYNLGDLVDLMGDDGKGARMRVIGNVITDDSEGLKSYPTFEMVDHISPDTWSGQVDGEVWATMPGVWRDYR